MATQEQVNAAILDKLSSIAQMQAQDKPRNAILNDEIFKFLMAGCGLAVLWLFSEAHTVGRDVLEVKTKMTILQNDVKKHDTLLDDPRFTKPDAVELINASVTPLAYKVNEVDTKLKSRGDWMGSTEKRITELERNFEHIQENLDDIKKLIKEQ